MKICNAKIGDSIFFSCGSKNNVEKILSIARNKLGVDLGLINDDEFSFCWIIDYPMFETDEFQAKLNLVTILFQCLKET